MRVDSRAGDYLGFLLSRGMVTHVLHSKSRSALEIVEKCCDAGVGFAVPLNEHWVAAACPDGAPVTLLYADIEVSVAGKDAVLPDLGAEVDATTRALRAIDNRLDALALVQHDGDIVRDRIEGIEFALAELARTPKEESLSEDLCERLERLSDRMERLERTVPPEDVDDVLSHFGALEDMLTEVLGSNVVKVPNILDMQSSLAEIAERPVPVVDLTAQRKSFARFNTSAAKVVKRLDVITGRLEQLAHGGLSSQDVATLLELATQSRSSLSQLAEKTGISMIEHSRIEALLQEFQKSIEVMLAEVSKNVAPTVSVQPAGDGLTALATAISRLSDRPQSENAGAGIDVMADLLEQVKTLAVTQQGLKEDFAVFSALLSPPGLSDGQAEFLQDMRYALAEFLAAQSRQNTLDAPPAINAA
ncbi:MAG: hypothetical protein ACJAQW_000719 [Paracoccaceae bacterium]|jgi:hypothetical protein